MQRLRRLSQANADDVPDVLVTGEEVMSTRGRANAIRAALELRGVHGDPLRSEELEAALSNCLSCKACTTECPSNVNLALLKAELLHARISRNGLNLRERLLSSVDRLGQLGCMMPRTANVLLEFGSFRQFGRRIFGFTTERPLPHFAPVRFDHWFAKRHTFHPAVARKGDSLGRHVCALLRTSYRHGRHQGAGNRRF